MSEATGSVAAAGRATLTRPSGPGSPPAGDRLFEAARALEGVFAQHLVQAMRATVPGGGNPDAPGADLYGALLDEHLAQTVAGDTRSGIAEAIYRQLSAAIAHSTSNPE